MESKYEKASITSSFKLKRKKHYRIDELNNLIHTGKCLCLCPVVFHPIIKMLNENLFELLGWRTTNSKGEQHHCNEYRFGYNPTDKANY